MDPDESVTVSSLLNNPLHCRPVAYVEDGIPLYDLLREFQTGKGEKEKLFRCFV